MVTTKRVHAFQEVLYHKVDFIHDPWYDDHFDIPTERQRIGKTLVQISTQTAEDDGLLSRGSQLVGWALYEKLDCVLSLMTQWADDGSLASAVTATMVCSTV